MKNNQHLFIDYERYKKSCRKLFSFIQEDIKSLRDDRCKTILLVGLHRGGSIPTTLLDYHLASNHSKDRLNVRSTVLHLSLRDGNTSNSRLLQDNVEAVNKFIKESLDSLLDFNPCSDNDLNFRVYFIEDLLDSGSTVNLLDSLLQYKKYFWYQQAKVLCLYDKQSVADTFPHVYPSNTVVINDLKEEGKLVVIDKDLKLTPETWLNFWYENL